MEVALLEPQVRQRREVVASRGGPEDAVGNVFVFVVVVVIEGVIDIAEPGTL